MTPEIWQIKIISDQGRFSDVRKGTEVNMRRMFERFKSTHWDGWKLVLIRGQNEIIKEYKRE